MKKPFYILFKVSIIVLLLISCNNSSYQPGTSWNLSSIYNPLVSYLHPSYKVYHSAQNTSTVFFKVRMAEFLFRPDMNNKGEKCHFTLRYLMQKIDAEDNYLVDSNTYIYEFNKSDVSKYYTSQILIKADINASYRLKIILRDNYRNVQNISYLDVEKHVDMGEQFFNITSLDANPIFRNIIINNGVFRINHVQPSSDRLFVSYFKNESPAPKPSINSLSDKTLYKKRDSLFIIDYNKNSALSLQYEGMYYAQFDTNSKEGISILKMQSTFPRVKEPEELLPPLAYITTDAEYSKLTQEKNSKKATDNFWVKTAGSMEKGREMIRLYYNRVYFSNYYFTNTKPGWKTDRGMVYIVYGPPQEMKKNAHSEIWIYKLKGDSNPISFTFKYSPNQYHLNNYTLQRSDNHTWHWTEAVYAWTSGDMFLFD